MVSGRRILDTISPAVIRTTVATVSASRPNARASSCKSSVIEGRQLKHDLQALKTAV